MLRDYWDGVLCLETIVMETIVMETNVMVFCALETIVLGD